MRISFILIILLVFTSCSKNRDTKPSDFNEFWQETINELDRSLNFEVIKDSIVDDKNWKLYKINSYKNIYFYAWVSEPLTVGKFPIKIRYSGVNTNITNKNIIQNDWFLKESNVINMLVDIRGQGLSIGQIKSDNFLINGLEDKQTYIYKGAYLDAVKAVDFVSINPKSDGNIIVTGGGQGGALAIVATAFNNKVTMCIVGFPFFTDISNYDKKEWPMSVFMFYCYKEEVDYFDLMQRLSYFDVLNFSNKLNVPVFIRAQERDNITPIEGAIKFYNKLKTEKKEIYIDSCEGHGCSTNSKKANDLEKLFIEKNRIHN